MKIKEKVQIKELDIVSFLRANLGEDIHIDDYDCCSTKFTFTTETNCTEAEFNMNVLRTLADSTKFYLTDEEKNAIDYAIGAIKTLADMGVLK